MASDSPIPRIEKGLFRWAYNNPEAADAVIEILNKFCSLEVAFGGNRFPVKFAGENALIDLKETTVASTSALPAIAAYTVLANATGSVSAPTAVASPILTSVIFGASGGVIGGTGGTVTVTASGSDKNITLAPSGAGQVIGLFNSASASASGFKASNSNSAGRSSFYMENSGGVGGVFNTYGSTFAVPFYQNNCSFGSDNAMIVVSNGSVASGGSSSIYLIGGGYLNSAALTVGPGNPGLVTIGGSITVVTKATIPKIVFNAAVLETFGNGSPEGVVTADVGSTFHRADGGSGTAFYIKESGVGNTGWVAASSGSGTVTNTGGALTANYVVLGAGTNDTKVVAGITTDGTSKLNLGVAGSSVGTIVLSNATSGTVTLLPVTGALGTVTLSIPAVTDTLVARTTTDTLTNKTLTAPVISDGSINNATVGATTPNSGAFTTLSATGGLTMAVSNSSSGFFAGNVSNSNASGRTTFLMTNDGGVGGNFGTYGSSFAVSSFRNNFVAGGDNTTIIICDGSVSSGGSNTIQFVTGGYLNSATLTISAGNPGLVTVAGAMTVTTSINVPKISNLTSNGFVKTSGGDGTLSVTSAAVFTSGTLTGLTGLAVRDTSASFDVTLAATSSTTLTAGRTLTLDVANAPRTLKLTGNPTLADWFDQSVKVAASPSFASIENTPIGLSTPQTGSFTSFSSTVADGTYGLRLGGASGKMRFLGYLSGTAYIDAVNTAENARIDLNISGNTVVIGAAGVNTAMVSGTGLAITGVVSTSAPAGASAGNWKLGSLVTGAVVADATRSLYVDVGGTVYKVMIST